VRTRWSAEVGGSIVTVLATAAVLFGWRLDPSLGYDQPLATL
jgi:hypothetical protein